MNKCGVVGAAGWLLALSWSHATLAQGNCGNIQFGPSITSQFPNARNACLDVVTREGRQFAHFKGRITRVSGNQVEAEFKLPDGTYGRPVSFTPPAEQRLRIAGQTYRFRDLSRGQELDVYLPPDRWEIAVPQDPTQEFVAAATITTVVLADVPQRVAALPRTASPLPFLGLLGGLFTALGMALVGVRQRLRRSKL